MIRLEGRVAIVTGASQGIGRDCALALAEHGADVALLARTREKLEAVAEEIRQRGQRALALPTDVTEAEQVKAAVARVLDEWGRIDILVNNAGITRDALLLRMKREDWDLVLHTNLTSVFLCCQAVLPTMLRARYGRIINITSVMGQMGNAGVSNYAASKAGIIGFTKALAREVASRNVTVNAIAPGFIDTDMTRVLNEDVRRQMLALIPLQRMGTGADVAAGVVFLASEEAGYITGHVLNINGGLYM
ncbi:MAG: 3-oxoacyl-[acyl-carrier-protein] reductase [Blastocatellia bacterium]|nr:3-oxoacyl-[acyl-carrier-protein] reductase [Blastocatellia bacterium]MCX7751919.1 3-oxoacyl-[acyl-carrier-protein] reductase [Blastocatellia bacterium]MDW8167025.1 3-oxoacyl-[acyl-carrier-protein] reductase [Acidobacteriota bacterium]MDW8257129.1 3-oxoacyl-[acyl-carrier-protein] reductase [Acidobacteriota bacterium]